VQTLAGYLFGTESVCGCFAPLGGGASQVCMPVVFSTGGCVWLFGWLRRTEAKIGDPFYRPMLLLLGVMPMLFSRLRVGCLFDPSRKRNITTFLTTEPLACPANRHQEAHTLAATFSIQVASAFVHRADRAPVSDGGNLPAGCKCMCKHTIIRVPPPRGVPITDATTTNHTNPTPTQPQQRHQHE
jgi:hypothetical protein